MKPITHRPKVGDILECDFGEWAIPTSFDGHIKPEMRKRRLVVILNGNLDGGACIVVPISSSDADALGFSARFHVHLPADRITTVSKARLFNIMDKSAHISVKLPPELVTAIQTQVGLAIGARSLLKT